MFSRLAARTGIIASTLRPQLQNQGILVLARPSSTLKHVENWDKANKIYYGPDRDTKNFPHPARPDTHPATRMGVFPESWFTFFHEKTGVTGPYVFGFGMITFMLSKEIWIIEHGFTEFIAFWIAAAIVTKKVGPSVAKYFDQQTEDFEKKRWAEPIANMKSSSEAEVADQEKAIWQEDGQKYLFEAKRENVGLQLESVYRQRLSEVYQSVKKRLDYQADLENSKRRYEQEHMVTWIVDSVKAGISPQQEKQSLAKCITDLKGLAAKA